MKSWIRCLPLVSSLSLAMALTASCSEEEPPAPGDETDRDEDEANEEGDSDGAGKRNDGGGRDAGKDASKDASSKPDAGSDDDDDEGEGDASSDEEGDASVVDSGMQTGGGDDCFASLLESVQTDLGQCRICHLEGVAVTKKAKFHLSENLDEDLANLMKAYEALGRDLVDIPADKADKTHGGGTTMLKNSAASYSAWSALLDAFDEPPASCD